MDDLEALKRKRLEELKNQQLQALQNQAGEQAEMQQQIGQLELIVKQALTKDALLRYGNIKAAHPEKAVQLLVVLGQMIQQGKIQQVSDALLKNILMKLTPEKRDFNIKRA